MSESPKQASTRRPKIGPQIVERFADGKWHALADIVASVHGAVDETHVLHTLQGMRKNYTYGVRCEVKRVGTAPHWRILPLENPISRREAINELRPIIEALKIEGRRNMATASPATVAALAGRLEKLLHKWTVRPAPLSGPRRRGRAQKDLRGDLRHDAAGNTKQNDSAGTAQLPARPLEHRANDEGVGSEVRDHEAVADRKAAES